MSIATSLQKVIDAKNAIRASINNKGGQVTSATPFSAYSEAIDNLPSGGNTGTPMYESLENTSTYNSNDTQLFDFITDVVIPIGVTTIDKYAFYNVTSGRLIPIDIKAPSGLTTIKERAFEENRKVSSITFDNGVSNLTTIEGYAFKGCNRLTGFTFPDTLTDVGNYAFSGCTSLTNPTIKSGVTYGQDVFNSCYAATAATIESGTTTVPWSAFYSCTGITEFNIPDTVTKIDGSAFRYTKVSALTIPDSVTEIVNAAFQGMYNLKSIEIPTGVTILDNYVLCGDTALNSVVLNEGLTTINSYSLAYCPALTTLRFPSTVTQMQSSVITGSTGLTSIYVLNPTPPTIVNTSLTNTANFIIYVPAASVEAYKAATNWSSYSSRIQAIPEQNNEE